MHTPLRSLALAICLLLIPLAGAFAASPATAQLTDAKRTVTYTGGPFTAPNRTDPVLGDGTTLVCAPSTCDEFALTVALPAGYVAAHPDAAIKVELKSNNGTADYDLYVRDAGGAYIAVGYSSGGTESAEFTARNGSTTYTIMAVPFSANADAFKVTITLLASNSATDTDRDRVADAKDRCPSTPPRMRVDRYGCSSRQWWIPSDPARARVVVADLDSAINPYHAFYYRRPSVVTREVLAELGVKPENVVKLTRTGSFARDVAADAGFWSSVKRGETYHFVGTNIVATSLANSAPYLKPTTAKNAHGVGTSGAVLTANPDAIILFVEANDALGSAESHRFAFRHPAVDIVTTSYGVSFASGLLPAPEYRTFEHSYEGVVGRGKLHFSSAGNGPGVSALRAGAGPWWSIGVSGIEEDTSEGDTLLSGNLPDFVSDFTQTLPYCTNCETGMTSVSGTSFSTPRSAGITSKLLLDVRRALKHRGGMRWIDGTPVMATNTPLTKRDAAKCGRSIQCHTVTNWQIRRALEQAAWVPDSTAYDPTQASGGGVGLPINPAAPWLQTAWGDLTVAADKGVLPAARAELRMLTGYNFGGTARTKPVGFCEFQSGVIEARKTWWNEVAPNLPDNPELTGETPPGAPAEDRFIYC